MKKTVCCAIWCISTLLISKLLPKLREDIFGPHTL